MNEKSIIGLLKYREEHKGESKKILNPLEKAKSKPTSKALAIRAKCFDCVGGESADCGWRRTVSECPSKKCPLWNLRPYQKSDEEDSDEDI